MLKYIFLLIVIFYIYYSIRQVKSFDTFVTNSIPENISTFINEHMVKYKSYNPELYEQFIMQLNKYYSLSEKDEEELKVAIQLYHDISFALPTDISFQHYESICLFETLINYEEKLEPANSSLNNYDE